MTCNTLTKAHFTSEQSLGFPLCVACSVRKLGRMNKISTPSLYRYLLTHWWRLCCTKAFPGRLPCLEFFVNRKIDQALVQWSVFQAQGLTRI